MGFLQISGQKKQKKEEMKDEDEGEEEEEQEQEETYSSAWSPGPTRGLPPVGKAAAGWLLSL